MKFANISQFFIYLTFAVAELVFGLLVMAVRGFYNGKSGTELLGKKLGILAFGNVGRIAKGFGMEVYAFDAYCPAEVIEKAGVHAVAYPIPKSAKIWGFFTNK